MTDTFDTQDDDQQDTGVLDPKIREELRQARKDRAALADAKAEADAMRREMAFTKAGIPEDGTGALLRKAYDGDMDPAAIKAAAEGYGILGGPPPADQQDETQSEELARLRAMQAGVRESGEPDPVAEQEYFAKMEALKRDWKPGREADLVDGVSAAVNEAQNRGLPVRLAQ